MTGDSSSCSVHQLPLIQHICTNPIVIQRDQLRLNSVFQDLGAQHSAENLQTREHYESIINDIQESAAKTQENVVAEERALHIQENMLVMELVCCCRLLTPMLARHPKIE